MPEESLPRLALAKETLLPIGVVLLLLGGASSSWIWLEHRFDAVQAEVSKGFHTAEVRMISIENKLTQRWTARDQQIWTQQLKIDNPELSVPDAMAIAKDRRVSR